MDPEYESTLRAELIMLRHSLSTLWANVCAEDADSLATAQRIGSEMAAGLRFPVAGDTPEKGAIYDRAATHAESFWQGVEETLRSRGESQIPRPGRPTGES